MQLETDLLSQFLNEYRAYLSKTEYKPQEKKFLLEYAKQRLNKDNILKVFSQSKPFFHHNLKYGKVVLNETSVIISHNLKTVKPC